MPEELVGISSYWTPSTRWAAPTETHPMLTPRVRTSLANGMLPNAFAHPATTHGAYSALAPRFKRTGQRHDISLATKFGFTRGKPSQTVDDDLEYVRRAFRPSLARLGTDYIDMYYMHRADPTVPVEVHLRLVCAVYSY